jgi:hypothetical protein
MKWKCSENQNLIDLQSNSCPSSTHCSIGILACQDARHVRSGARTRNNDGEMGLIALGRLSPVMRNIDVAGAI